MTLIFAFFMGESEMRVRFLVHMTLAALLLAGLSGRPALAAHAGKTCTELGQTTIDKDHTAIVACMLDAADTEATSCANGCTWKKMSGGDSCADKIQEAVKNCTMPAPYTVSSGCFIDQPAGGGGVIAKGVVVSTPATENYFGQRSGSCFSVAIPGSIAGGYNWGGYVTCDPITGQIYCQPDDSAYLIRFYE